MPDMLAFCKWLEQTWIGGGVRESLWLFPAIETVHLLGMAVLIGTVGVFDLRLMGWMRQRRVSDLAARLLPWSWVAFAVQVITGTILFSSEAVKVYSNPAFRVKMLLILLAGVQVLIFQLTQRSQTGDWDEQGIVPASGKLAGAVSLVLWIGVITAGRFIGFM
jgi:hypothetical protein